MIVSWLRDEEGEWNEVVATINGHEVRVFSDREGDLWTYRIDDDVDAISYDTCEQAQQAAVEEAQSL